MIKKWFMRSYLFVVLAFMYIPLIVLFVFSFSSSVNLNWTGGFTFQTYIDLFTGSHAAAIRKALMNTFIIAIASGVFSLILGTLGAIGINSMKKRSRNIVSTVAKLPMINAEIITALSLMVFFAIVMFIPLGYVSLIIAHTAFCTPYVLLSILPKLQQVNNNTYEAALDLGARPTQALMKVIVPQILPAMITGFLMAVTISMDDFVITQFNKGTVETLSTFIYTITAKKPLPPELRAYSLLFFAVALLILFVVNRMSNRNHKNDQKI